MKKMPEGARRLCIVLGVLPACAVLVWAGAETNYFRSMSAEGFYIFTAMLVGSLTAPTLSYHVFSWVRDGFKNNNMS